MLGRLVAVRGKGVPHNWLAGPDQLFADSLPSLSRIERSTLPPRLLQELLIFSPPPYKSAAAKRASSNSPGGRQHGRLCLLSQYRRQRVCKVCIGLHWSHAQGGFVIEVGRTGDADVI